MFSFFLLQVGIGLPACAGLVPTRTVGKGFHLLNGGIAAACLALAIGMGGRGFGAGAAPFLLWGTLAGLALYLGVQFGRARRFGWLILGPALLAGAAVLVGTPSTRVSVEAVPGLAALLGADAILGALLPGAVLAAMNLGHWYLVIPSLPISILKRLTAVFVVTLAARSALLGVVAWLIHTGSLPLPDGFLLAHAVFLIQRVLFGFAVPVVLSVLIWKTVVTRSTQSATGILYVAVFFILMGELIASHLRFLSGVPF